MDMAFPVPGDLMAVPTWPPPTPEQTAAQATPIHAPANAAVMHDWELGRPPASDTPGPDVPDGLISWPQRLNVVHEVYTQSMPQPTAQLDEPEVMDPTIRLPELAGFRQMHQWRQELLRHQALGVTSTSEELIRQASGVEHATAQRPAIPADRLAAAHNAEAE